MAVIDIASIVFVCVTANHLGLIQAIEEIAKRELPIINCPKCLSCWCVFAYALYNTHDVIVSLAVSFIASYLALWLELAEGIIDKLYMIIYEKIISTHTNNSSATSADGSNTADTLP